MKKLRIWNLDIETILSNNKFSDAIMVIGDRVKLDLENIGIEEAEELWNQLLGGISSCMLKPPVGWQWLHVNEKGQVPSYG